MRSATTHQLLAAKPKLSSSSFNTSDRKERTPYRLQKNKSRYLGDSNDSGYLTTASSTNGRTAGGDSALVDDNYPLDYTGSRYRTGARNYGNHYDHRYNDEYDPSTSRYSRQGEYASSYKPRSGLDYSNYYDGSRLGPNSSRYESNDLSNSSSSAASRRQKTYGRNKTSDSLVTAAGEASAGGRPRYEPPPDEFEDRNNHALNSRNRFAHKRAEVASVGSSTHRAATSNKMTEEELEILNDDRSSADNAAILIALRDDGQYLEAKKFEERMRKRTELKDRMARYAQEAEKAKELQKVLEEKERELEKLKDKEREMEKARKQDANNNLVEVTSREKAKDKAAGAATTNGVKEKAEDNTDSQPQKKVRSKKVTNETDTTDSSNTSSEDEEEDDEESESSSDDNTLSSTKATSQTRKQSPSSTDTTQTSTTSTNTTSATTTSTKPTSNYDKDDPKSTKNPTALSTTTSSSSTTSSRYLHNDKIDMDLSKYRPQPIVKPNTTGTSSSGLMHSSSSGALAFGGISERLGLSGTSSRQTKPYAGAATSRTAAVLSEFENSGPSSRYPATRADHYLDSYKSSYLYEPYTSAYGPSSSSRRPTAATGVAAGVTSSSTLTTYQRQQLQAYHQQQQHYQQQQHQLSKSATSSSLFHRSRIPKTFSSFVRSLFPNIFLSLFF